jgi:membrane fusion protein (multidrug efflux system)
MRARNLLLLSAALFSGCGPRESPGPGTPEAVPVEVLVLHRQAVPEIVTASGILEGIRDVTLTSQVAGRVERVAVQLGDRVAEGDTLVAVDDRLLRDQVAQAEAALRGAEAAWEKAKADLTRQERLFAQGHLSPGEIEAYRAQAKGAEASVASARAALATARHRWEDAFVLSPFRGRVAAVFVQEGQEVVPGMPLVRLVATDTLKLPVGVSEDQISQLRPGLEARVRASAQEDLVVAGWVEAVGPAAQPGTGTFPVEVRLANASGALKPGMTATAEILRTPRRPVLLVPRRALMERYGQEIAFVVHGGRARKKVVTIGTERDGSVEILGGLEEGDSLVVMGQHRLRDGMPVAVSTKVAS